MMNRRAISILAAIAAMALAGIACSISVPSTNTIATNVVASVVAIEKTAALGLTPEVHLLPTLAPSTAETPMPATAPLSVAFVSPDKNAYYWNETLPAPIMLSASGDVENAYVSQDGNLVALTRTTDNTAYTLDVINKDGSGMRTLISSDGFAALPRPADSLAAIPYQVAWIDNTHMLAMNTRNIFEGPGLSSGNTLYIINADDGSMTAPITLPDVFYFRFSFSPDGTKIAISLPDGIEIYHPDGSTLDNKVLSYEFVNTASEYAWVASPVWSADSSTLVAVVPPVEPFASPAADSTVWRVAADGLSGEMMLSRQMMYFPSGFAGVSPDLSQILYLTRFGPPTDNQYAINISNIDGTASEQYSTGAIYGAPQWSLDSSKFYFFDRSNGAFIGQKGLPPLALPDFAHVKTVQWIDGNRFIGATGPEGGWKLLLGTVGSPTGVIYSTPATDGTLVFTVNRH